MRTQNSLRFLQIQLGDLFLVIKTLVFRKFQGFVNSYFIITTKPMVIYVNTKVLTTYYALFIEGVF